MAASGPTCPSSTGNTKPTSARCPLYPTRLRHGPLARPRPKEDLRGLKGRGPAGPKPQQLGCTPGPAQRGPPYGPYLEGPHALPYPRGSSQPLPPWDTEVQRGPSPPHPCPPVAWKPTFPPCPRPPGAEGQRPCPGPPPTELPNLQPHGAEGPSLPPRARDLADAQPRRQRPRP